MMWRIHQDYFSLLRRLKKQLVMKAETLELPAKPPPALIIYHFLSNKTNLFLCSFFVSRYHVLAFHTVSYSLPYHRDRLLMTGADLGALEGT